MKTALDVDGTITVQGGRATVTFERRYARPRADVWDAITNPARLAVWLDSSTVELRVGGRFDIHFSDSQVSGTITELTPPDVIAYSWHEDRADASHVRWQLSDDGDGTLVRLEHTRLPVKSADGFAAGWHHHLDRLQGLLDGTDTNWSDERFAELRSAYSAKM